MIERRCVYQSLTPDEWERAGIVPHDLFVDAGRHGYLGMAIPEQYGGGGADDFEPPRAKLRSRPVKLTGKSRA